MQSQHFPVIIIGAGLSGLYAAWRLQQQGIKAGILESRDRIGGRILGLTDTVGGASHYDLGPAWCWPEFQPRLASLTKTLTLPLFQQYCQGELLYELKPGTVQRHQGPSSHTQSYRIAGGNQRLVESLSHQLTEQTIILNTQVQEIQATEQDVTLICNSETHYTADKVLLCLPPRLIATQIRFDSTLQSTVEPELLENWRRIPTWMASHCKKVFIYDTAFWREQGLSGEVFSHAGPLSEIYDASPVDNSQFALTSFLGINAAQRQQLTDQDINQACLAQLTRLFGNAAGTPLDILSYDWSQDPYTSHTLDLSGPAHHPVYAADLPRELSGRLFLAGTETAQQHGGYLEGALESVDQIIDQLYK